MITIKDINFLLQLANRLHAIQPLSDPESEAIQKIVQSANEMIEAAQKEQKEQNTE